MALRRGTRVSIFDFTEGDNEWNYCESAVDIHVPDYGKTYQAQPITPGTIKERSKIGENDSFTLKLPKDTDLAQHILARNLSYGVSMVSRVIEVDTSAQVTVSRLVARGHVVSHEEDTGTISLEIESLAQSLGDLGLRKTYGMHCTHNLYSGSCGVNKEDHSRSVIISDVLKLPRGGALVYVQTNDLVVDEWSGGFIEFTHNGILLTSRIISNKESRLSIDVKPNIDLDGLTATLVKGCDLAFETCQNTFNNHERFGGFPYFSESLNPFEDDTFSATADPIVFSTELLPNGYYVVRTI